MCMFDVDLELVGIPAPPQIAGSLRSQLVLEELGSAVPQGLSSGHVEHQGKLKQGW